MEEKPLEDLKDFKKRMDEAVQALESSWAQIKEVVK